MDPVVVEGDNHGAHRAVDELEIDFDIEGNTAEIDAMPNDPAEQGDEQENEFQAHNLNLETEQDGQRELAGDDAPEQIPSALKTVPGDPRNEPEIVYEELVTVEADNPTHDEADQGLPTEASYNNGVSGGVEEEDEITYEDDEVVPMKSQQGATHSLQFDGAAPQQVLDDENDGMAFDFEDAADDSADHNPNVEHDGSSENSEAQESFAEEIGLGPLEDIRPDPGSAGYEEGYSSSSESIGAGAPRPASGGQSRPSVLVQYNGHAYDLFARTHNANPENYFLSQLAALDYSLTQFLASLRGMLSGDITDKERITFRIESLGLEFGETTSRDFLDQKSFRMILSLYEGLVNNDKSATSGPLYAHLVTHVDCAARFDELEEGVKKGLGLSSFASSAGYAGQDYGFTANEPTNGEDDAGAELEEQYESSEHYSEEEEDESAEDEAAADHGGSTTMSGAIGSVAEENENGDDEDDEERDSYLDDDAADDYDDQLDDGGGQDQMAYDDAANVDSYETNDSGNAAFGNDQPSVGAFVEEAGHESVDAQEKDGGVQEEDFEEGGEEFLDYDQDLEETAIDQVAQTNGNLTPSAMSAHRTTPATALVEDDDLIDYSDDEEPVVKTNKVLAWKSERSDPTSPCHGKGRRPVAAENKDFVGHMDNKVGDGVKAALSPSKRLVTSVTSQSPRFDEPLELNGTRYGPSKASCTAVSPPRAGTAGYFMVGHSQDESAPSSLLKAANSNPARGIKMVTCTMKPSPESFGSAWTVDSDFSLHLSGYADADLLDYQDAATHGLDEFEHETNNNMNSHGMEQTQNLIAEPNSGATQQPLDPNAYTQTSHETASHPTSTTSTLHGEEGVRIDSAEMAPTNTIDGMAQSSVLTAPEVSIDEIDWEEHGDDEQTFVADQQTAGIPAKRGRQTDDAGISVEETEAKRRRT